MSWGHEHDIFVASYVERHQNEDIQKSVSYLFVYFKGQFDYEVIYDKVLWWKGPI